MPLWLAIALVLGGLWLAIRAFTGCAGDLKDGYGFLESDTKRIVMVVSDSIIKGIISTLFKAVIALIGEDTITGQFKMIMGIDELESGMALVPLLIGVFVISEVIIQAEKAAKVKMIDFAADKVDDPTAHYFT